MTIAAPVSATGRLIKVGDVHMLMGTVTSVTPAGVVTLQLLDPDISVASQLATITVKNSQIYP